MKKRQVLAWMLSVSMCFQVMSSTATAEEISSPAVTQNVEEQSAAEEAAAEQPETQSVSAEEPVTEQPETQPISAEEPEAQQQPSEASSKEDIQKADGAKETASPQEESQSKQSAGQAPQEDGEQEKDTLEAAARENFLRIVSETAYRSEGEIQVELATQNPDYDTLYFGNAQDTERKPIFTGEKNDLGGYTFTFVITPDLVGKIVPYVPGKQEKEWYTDHNLYLKLPKEVLEAKNAKECTEGNTEEESWPESPDPGKVGGEPEVSQNADDETSDSPEELSGEDTSVLFLEEAQPTLEEEALFLEAGASGGTFDNATTLEDGEYTPEEFKFEGGTGKAYMTCEKVIVSGGKATAFMTASSVNMTHVYLGTAPSGDETAQLYNPDTNTCAANVYAIQNKAVTIPVKLNQEVALAARTIAMSVPHWVQYHYTITLEEPEKETETETETESETETETEIQRPAEGKTILSVTNNTGMFKADLAYLNTKNGVTTLVMTMSGSGYHYMYKGTYEAAVANGNKRSSWIKGKQNSAGKWEFGVPLADGETYIPMVAISQIYLDKYDSGSSTLERAFFPRQLTINVTDKTLVTDDYNEDVQVTVTSKVSAVKVESKAAMNVVGGPNSNNYACTPVLKMKNDTYDKVKYPTVINGAVGEETAALSSDKTFTIRLRNAPAVTAFEDKTAFNVSFRKKSTGKWVKYSMTIDKLGKKITIGDAAAESSNGNNGGGNSGSGNGSNGGGSTGSGSAGGGGTNGSTSAVNSSTGLKDGDYAPDSFSWSGGTGKLSISCSKITVSGGKTYAAIVFSSGKIIYVKADGNQYNPVSQTSDTSTFEIPVQLNANNKILACTTAMSQPHEVEYTLYIGLEAAKKASLGDTSGISASSKGESGLGASSGSAGAADGSELEKLEDAPKIAGLEYQGTAKNEYAKYFRLHYYAKNFRVLEISLSAREQPDWSDQAKAGDAQDGPDESADIRENINESAGTQGTDEALAGNMADSEEGSVTEQKSLYEGGVLQYLIAPEGEELPAGIDKDMIVAELPVEKVYVDSDTALKMLDKLGLTEKISTVGMSGQECGSDSVVRAMADGAIESIGHYDETSIYKALVTSGTKLAIVPADILPKTAAEDADANMDQESYVQNIGDNMNLLKIPMIVDRADDEKEQLARYEWLKVYGALFDCEKEAGEAFQAAQEALKKDAAGQMTEAPDSDDAGRS